MVAGTRDSTQQPQAPAEDEALKRNTDCVYFLASPLTCKKGGECEYRHSEYARVNPRDCWYWLNGNCLNPKCAFRHPPLDGLLGTQAATSSGSSLPTPQTAAAPATHATHATYNPVKQGVPCIFFQKGLCLKGDKCAFLHGPNPIGNKVPQVPAATPLAEPLTLKKTFGVLEKCNQEQKLPLASVSKSVEVPTERRLAAKAETATPKNGVAIDKSIPPPTSFNDVVLSYKATSVPPVSNGNIMSRSNRIPQADVSDDQSFHNGKDADEFYRESSPGFDVLVDDELGDSEYYPDEDQFGRRGHEGRNLNSMNEFDIGRSADYNSVADVDREMFRDPRGYDSYEQRMQGQYAWEQRRASSERVLMGSAPLDRRSYRKSESPDRIDESDLRHHLSKHRRVNGLRSVISHDHALDNHNEERSYRGSRRESRHLPPHESSLSGRLRGRIKLPGRSSPVNGSDLRSEREMDRGRNFGRLSPGRPQFSSHQGRLRDRIKGRVQEDLNNEERNFSGPRMRDIMDDRSADFAAPKRLSELKSKEQQMKGEESFSLGKRKSLKVEDHQQSEVDLSFEGPKPLSEILKRKRVAETAVSGSESKESLIGGSSKTLAVTETRTAFSSLSEKEANLDVVSIEEESKSATADAVGRVEDGLIPTEKGELGHGQSSRVANIGEIETEEGMIVDEGMEDHELEAFDHRDGDFDYEQVDGGDYNLEEGENADPEEEEYLDDEDGDDFAKKIGVLFS